MQLGTPQYTTQCANLRLINHHCTNKKQTRSVLDREQKIRETSIFSGPMKEAQARLKEFEGLCLHCCNLIGG